MSESHDAETPGDDKDQDSAAAERAYHQASREWRASLIDVSANNRLLYFRPTQSTLSLRDVPRGALDKLLTGSTVRLSELFPDPSRLETAQRACKLLAQKQREAREEYGVSVAYLAVGLASWDPVASDAIVAAESEDLDQPKRAIGARRPQAPVFMRPVEVAVRRGAQTAWELTLDDDFQLNGVFQHVMNADRVRLPEDDDFGLGAGSLGEISQALGSVQRACADISDFEVADDLILGAFSYLKQPMVSDVDDITAIAVSDLVAALAGDREAATRVRAQVGDVSERQPDYAPVDSEFLVVDADASQSYVVNATLAGRNLVVQGPPGTGKSQTIANLIAGLVASGKSVLFVAQKRAAISAVLDRLDHVGLAHLILDMFASTGSRRYIAEQLQRVLEHQRTVGVPDVAALEWALDASRRRLVEHHDALHSPTHAWGLSIHDLRVRSSAVPVGARVHLRLPSSLFDQWEPTSLNEYEQAVDELARIGYFSPGWQRPGGWRPHTLATTEHLVWADGVVQRVGSVELPRITQDLARCASALCFETPTTWDEARGLVALNEQLQGLVAAAPALYSPQVSDAVVARYAAASDKALGRRLGADLSWRERRAARKECAALVAGPGLHDPRRLAVAAYEHRARGASTGAIPTPIAVQGLAEAIQNTIEALTQLEPYVARPLATVPIAEIGPILKELQQDQRRLQMPRANELALRLGQAGLQPLVDLLVRSGREEDAPGAVAPNAVAPSATLRWVVLRSILDAAQVADYRIGASTGAALNAATAEFQANDHEHLAANVARIKRAQAERLKAAFDTYPEEHQVLKAEVSRKRNFRPIRRLFTDAPHVLQAAKPVWAMSPLQVSRFLPLEQCFDVVIFDEASQVRPADAIPSLIRGRQAVVAGDTRQLPPTEFFAKVLEESEVSLDEVDDESMDLDAAPSAAAPRVNAESFTRDAESILFAMDRLLAGQSRRLLWHYRSRDERLISVSNAGVYDHSLTTFPAADATDVVRHVVVPYSPGVKGTANSPDAEVRAVVDLVKEHLVAYPDQSLGVITFGVAHQRRIEDALEAAATQDVTLRTFLDSDGHEDFFVKSIERVQGDERDRVILTMGYGKGADGRVRLFWGPLLKEGGERRLNVAISRARRHMTLVTSFDADDIAPDAHPSAGFRLMVQYVRFMASGGRDLTTLPTREVELNAFEVDVRDRLQAVGLQLDCQVGVAGYRIDFAVRHPEKPGRHVLAIEADGASYHSGHIARERDRLRQTLLESRGWKFVRIWSTDWFNDADAEVERVRQEFLRTMRELETDEAIEDDAPDVEPAKWHSAVADAPIEKPSVYPGLPIGEYDHAELVSLVRYVRRDRVLRSRDAEFDLLMAELGFARKGNRIVAALTAALEDPAAIVQ
ncbi:AAA domain-containing protein [Demequina sp.]|uniref:AAA domain-containing protein n=1 Tax=Demequina sp. TaxID=2050685 RepID=UPI003D0B8C34